LFYLRRAVLVIAVWGDDGKAIGMWENEIYVTAILALIKYNPHSAPQNVTEGNYGDENQREHQNKQIK